MKKILFAIIGIMCLMSCGSNKTFTLWQLESQINTIGNSYVIRTVNGKVIVMDGGYDKDYLRGFIDALGGEVEAWIISHPHDDHMTALSKMLENLNGLKISKVYHSRFLDELIDSEDANTAELTRKFYSLLDNATDIEVIDCNCGDEFEIDGVNFKVLSEKNPEIRGYNESSMVVKVWDNKKSIIFLGDLAVKGGQKLLDSEYAKDLECDYLQMAHHGQDGCDKHFYETVKFRACLWPSPSWVYNNDQGGGFNTGRLKTVEVRNWMKELGITEHYVSCEGLVRID